MTDFSIGFWISVAIFLIVFVTFIWQWQDRKKKKPYVLDMTLQVTGKNYFNVTMFNNASYNLIIYKAFKGKNKKAFKERSKKANKEKFWKVFKERFFRKRMSIGINEVNNESHSDTLAKQKLGNLDLSLGSNAKHFKMFLELNENISEMTFFFKTNSGTCKKRTEKIPA